jgi:PAS domain S-box-containing protein
MIQVEEPKKAESTGRVLIYIPVGEDVSTIRGILAGLAVEGVICTDIQDLCQRVMREDTSAVLLAESALTDGALPLLAEALQMQPSWSDLPILFVASGGPESPLAVQAMQDLPNVLVFDRPVRLATLAGALRMALRIRDKQRQVRDLLEERQRREEALRRSEERYRFLVESVNDWIWEVDRGSVYTYVGPQCRELLGYEPEEIVGKTPYDLMPPEEARRIREVFESIVSQAKPFRQLENVNRRKDGRLAVLETNGAPIFDAQGNLAGYRGMDRDITEHKRAEEALRTSEEQFHQLFEDDLTGNFLSTPDGRILLCNPAFAAIFGFSCAADAVGTSIVDLYLDPGERPSLVERLRNERKIERLEVWRKRRDGQPIHIVENLVGRFNEQGRLYEIKGYTFEDTQRQQAEEALRESEERLHLALGAARMGVWQWEVGTQQVVWSPELYGLLGYESGQMTPTHEAFRRRIHPQDLARWHQAMRESMERCEDYACEFRVVWADGSVHWVEARGQYTYSRDESATQAIWMRGVLSDIERRKRAEEALRESQEQFRMMANAIPQLAWIARADGYIYWYNQRWYEYTGTTPEQMEGWGWQSVHDPRELPKVLERWKRSLATGQPFDMIFPLRGADGIFRPFLTRVMPLKDPQGQVRQWFGTNTDVSQQKRAEEMLRELNATLESKVAQRTAKLRHRTRQLQKLALEMSEAEDRERERLAQILHDDLQQELAAAKFHLSVVRSRIKYDPSVLKIAARVDQMLKDAIGKSRSLSHELSPAVLRQGDFAEILHWLANQMQAKHGLAVHVQGRARVPSDPIKAFLYRTAQELLFNAVKHAQVQEARARVRQCGGYVCLSVSDRGRGFDPEKLREAAGFGLLSIRERIELLGGRMKIRSAPDQGSTFFVIVPNSETATPLNGRTEGAERPTVADDGRLRVVLAYDHDIVRQGLAALLSEEDAVKIVGETTNGREALELAERLHPDVVVMDVSMPVMSGEEATRRIKQELPQTRIVALSMREEPEVREKMCAAGAESYVLKTAPYKELLAAIRGRSEIPCESTA